MQNARHRVLRSQSTMDNPCPLSMSTMIDKHRCEDRPKSKFAHCILHCKRVRPSSRGQLWAKQKNYGQILSFNLRASCDFRCEGWWPGSGSVPVFFVLQIKLGAQSYQELEKKPFLASWDAFEPGLVSKSLSNTVEPAWLMWPWWVKIPTEDFSDVTLAIGDTYGDVRSGDWGDGHGG